MAGEAAASAAAVVIAVVVAARGAAAVVVSQAPLHYSAPVYSHSLRWPLGMLAPFPTSCNLQASVPRSHHPAHQHKEVAANQVVTGFGGRGGAPGGRGGRGGPAGRGRGG